MIGNARRLKSLLRTLSRRSSHRHWANLANHNPEWDARTRALASLVPSGTRVIELGAGRRQLERWLPRDCTYVPADLVDRGPGTLVCDLNQRPLPEIGSPPPQVAVFGGVIEYISDLPSVLAWLGPGVPLCVISYNCARPSYRRSDRAAEIWARLRAGWVNHYTEVELISVFDAAGYGLVQKTRGPATEGDENLYSFLSITRW